MADKLFVIAIGGTGMRCLESFTHLCAIGMFDNQEIEILTLDTDATNGNKARVEGLIENYNRIKTYGSEESVTKGGTPNSNSFFSAKLNLHKYWTNYSGEKRNNFKALSQIDQGTVNVQETNKLLADLFLDTDTVQEFDLSHGYRAQTHLGSMLMYHGIVESARNCAQGKADKPELDLEKFCDKLVAAGTSARVFILGSIFGGTGASSIPVIPKALKKFAEVRSNNQSTINIENVKFGANLLTEYFTFKKPDNTEKKDKKNSVIADSSFFPLNSQAALQFYQADPTVKKCYKTLYHIGWPLISKRADDEAAGKTITGGEAQKNGCHVTELLSACAAYDFFTRTKGMEDSVNNAEYVYKSAEFVDGSFNFKFDDFVGSENNAGKNFANRLGAFFSLAHICLSKNDGASGGTGNIGVKGFIKQLSDQNIKKYDGLISDEECKDINDYFKLFAYESPNGKFEAGWLYQVNNSVTPGKFMFDSKSFPNSPAELKGLDVGSLFLDKAYHWSDKGMFSNRYDNFIKVLLETDALPEQKVNTIKEKFLAHIFNGITKSQPNLITS